MRQTHCPGLTSISHTSPIWSYFEDIQCFARYISYARINFPKFSGFLQTFTPRILSELVSSDRFHQMSGPALPPNPSGDPPSTPTKPFTPTGSMTKGKGYGVVLCPPRPP